MKLKSARIVKIKGEPYLASGKDIDALAQVGALSDAELRVAHRVDRMRGNSWDGVLKPDEILRAQTQKGCWRTLLPNEKPLVPGLLRLFKWAELPVAPLAPQLEPLEVHDLSRMPAADETDVPLPIESLPEEWRETAMRVQLVANADSDDQTLQLADLERVLAAPDEGFNDSDIEEMRALHEQLLSRPLARVVVPMPGTQIVPLMHNGQTPLSLVVHTLIREIRAYNLDIPRSLQLSRHSVIRVEPPPAHSVLLVPHDEDGDDAPVKTAEDLTLKPGLWRVQLLKGGVLVEESDVHIPAHGHEVVEMGRYFDHELVADGMLLHRVLVDGAAGQSSFGQQAARAEWHYAAEPEERAVNNAAAIEDLLATPASGLLPGRYCVPEKNIVVDVYSARVVSVAVGNGAPIWLGARGPQELCGSGGEHWVVLEPADGHNDAELTIRPREGGPGTITATLTSSMRVDPRTPSAEALRRADSAASPAQKRRKRTASSQKRSS